VDGTRLALNQLADSADFNTSFPETRANVENVANVASLISAIIIIIGQSEYKRAACRCLCALLIRPSGSNFSHSIQALNSKRGPIGTVCERQLAKAARHWLLINSQLSLELLSRLGGPHECVCLRVPLSVCLEGRSFSSSTLSRDCVERLGSGHQSIISRSLGEAWGGGGCRWDVCMFACLHV